MGTSSSSLENREMLRRQRQQLQPFAQDATIDARGTTTESPPYFLMYGGPQLPSRPPQPYAAMLHYQFNQNQQGQPPSSEEQEMIAVKNLATVDKASLQLVPLGGGDHCIRFSMDCTVTTTVEVRFACVEIVQSGLQFVPQNDHLVSGPSPVTVPPGAHQVYQSDPSCPFNVNTFAHHLRYYPHCPNLYPLVLTLSYKVPETGARQAQHTYLQVITSPTSPLTGDDGTGSTEEASPSGVYTLRAVKQKLEIDGAVYELEEIYGMSQEWKPGNSEEIEGDTCVICISQRRNTTVMPCRHMCLCSECAEQLRGQTNKCPICRAQIERLVTIHRQAPS
eukprot:GGOE01014327.1.p1 GENE.GGOE01014327.1~~GGOE01014327.1.p1  ORF type:complete len:335 (+),score=28.49 GGOE01014327.1:61-1065(+)